MDTIISGPTKYWSDFNQTLLTLTSQNITAVEKEVTSLVNDMKTSIGNDNVTSFMPTIRSISIDIDTKEMHWDHFKPFLDTHLERVTLGYVPQVVNTAAFLPFRHTRAFCLVNSVIGLENAIQRLWPFENSNMTEIQLDNVNNGHPHIM